MNAESPRALPVFLTTAFGLSTLLSAAVAATGRSASPFAGLAVVAMFFPAIAVIAARVATGAPPADAGWRRFPIRWLPAALLAMPLTIHAVALPVTAHLEGGLPWLAWLSPAADGLIHTPESRGWGELTAVGLVGRVALNAVLGLLLVSVFALFEEIGWRAWMLPRLVARWGERQGALASAAIWAAWHAPYALSGIHDIPSVPATITAFALPIGHLGAGLVLAALDVWHPRVPARVRCSVLSLPEDEFALGSTVGLGAPLWLPAHGHGRGHEPGWSDGGTHGGDSL